MSSTCFVTPIANTTSFPYPLSFLSFAPSLPSSPQPIKVSLLISHFPYSYPHPTPHLSMTYPRWQEQVSRRRSSLTCSCWPAHRSPLAFQRTKIPQVKTPGFKMARRYASLPSLPPLPSALPVIACANSNHTLPTPTREVY